MAFATINSDLSYWRKQDKPLFDNLIWNIPEQKTGHVAIIGGNSQNFSTVVRISEFINQTFPIKTLTTVLPDALRGKLPPLPNLDFLPSTESGSFAKSRQLELAFSNPNSTLIIGDLSRNSATAVAISDAIAKSTPEIHPNFAGDLQDSGENSANLLVLARDSVDLLAPEASNWLNRPNTIIIASMAQLQKLFRAVYYPRMILLSQPLIPTIETLHKFTLTYPVTLFTFHQDNIIVASAGEVSTTHLVDTNYSPISLWSGQLAARVTALNLYNPKQNFAATTAAVLIH